MTPGYALRCACTGACIGCVIIAGFVVRSAVAITKSGGWPDAFRIAGVRYH